MCGHIFLLNSDGGNFKEGGFKGSTNTYCDMFDIKWAQHQASCINKSWENWMSQHYLGR